MNINRDLDLLYEIGTLRFIPRAWRQMLGGNFANLAEHHFRVAWIAMILAKMEGRGDTGKIVKMALVHDLAESRTGDAHYMSRLYVKRDNVGAIHDILKDTGMEKEMLELWEECEKLESIEAKIVKDADWLDVDLELREQDANGNVLEKNFRTMRVESMIPRLKTEAGKKLFDLIGNSNPHDWHIKGKNRITSGDWKKEEGV